MEIKCILRTEEIDVLCLQETFLTSETNDNQLAVENYGIFRRNRPTGHGGGIIVYVHNRIEARRCLDLEDANLELIWLELRQWGHPGKFLCGFIYRPPNVKAQIDSNIVSNLEGAILNSNETWLLVDVNINLTETNPLPSLLQTLSDIGLHQLISGVTRPASQTCLDHIYSTIFLGLLPLEYWYMALQIICQFSRFANSLLNLTAHILLFSTEIINT